MYSSLTGEMHMGGQEHFYLETNVTLAVPGEDGEMELFVSTQAACKTQVTLILCMLQVLLLYLLHITAATDALSPSVAGGEGVGRPC